MGLKKMVTFFLPAQLRVNKKQKIMKKYYFFMLICVLSILLTKTAIAQGIFANLADPVNCKYILEGEDLPELEPYPHSQLQPSYGFFWIFEDDGTFSFHEDAIHYFNGNNNHVCMEATPRYTPINRLPEMVCKIPNSTEPISTTTKESNSEFPFSRYSESIHLQSSRDPFNGHQRTIIVSYENPFANEIKNAKITLYFNSNQSSLFQVNQEFNRHNLIVDASNNPIPGIKAYNNETIETANVVMNNQPGNLDSKIEITISTIAKNSTHNLFFRFQTTDVIGDVNMRAYINGSTEYSDSINQVVNLDQKVVSAYDPNKIIVDKKVVCYDDIVSYGEKLTYTVYFQNEGDGATDGLGVIWPYNNGLEVNSLQYVDSKFDRYIDQHDQGSGVKWDFRELSLPGTNQLGFECDQEATTGWLKFYILTHNREFYANHGSVYNLLNSAIIEFPGISFMETAPVSTILLEDCGEMKNQELWKQDDQQSPNDNCSLNFRKVYRTNSHQLKVSISGNQMEELSIFLSNSLGQIVFKESLSPSHYPNSEINIPLQQLTEGLYIITVQGKRNKISKKIIL